MKESSELRVNLGEVAVRTLLSAWRARRLAAQPGAAGTFPGGREKPTELPMPQPPPALLVGGPPDLPCPSRHLATELDGNDDSEEALPAWAAELALGRVPPPQELPKLSFYLSPFPGSGLPPLGQAKLSAPRVLPMKKVASYVVSVLGNEKKLQGPVPGTIELVCAETQLAMDVTLATASATIWKRGEDLVLQYRAAQA
mmetsp:Transcript_25434/g.87107  ORF Transcript_25434/g.87107 Transcript_25434/m.87107 type:complete len:199 (-) Transcript_25434:62-658(-)